MGKIDGKVAIITGAASGNGKAAAILFAQEGAKVVVADIADGPGEETVKTINESGGKAVFVHADVSKAEDVKNMVKTAVDTYGKLDIIFNNAGKESPFEYTANYPEKLFDEVIAVDLKGTLLGMKYAVQELLKTGGGSIINMSSIMGILPGAGMSSYGAAKSGVIQLTKIAAVEYAKQNIRVNCIAPGIIETPMVVRQFRMMPRTKVAMGQKIPIGRFGKPEEIAKAALFLASDDSSYITAHVLQVDGGLTSHQ